MANEARMLVMLTEADLARVVDAAVTKALAARAAANDAGMLTTEAAAKHLGKSRKALLRLVSRGKIRPDVWGRRGKGATHLFSRATLDKFTSE